jgi:hypothetical protein
MQFSLRTLLILMAVICVYCGILNTPAFIAIPLFCAVTWVSPAYWITGLIYAREARRAFFIGGLSAGTVPFLVLVFFSLMTFDGPWYWGRFDRYEWGETQLVNLMVSLLVFAPVALAFIGGWIALAVYHSVQPQAPVPSAPPFSPALPAMRGPAKVGAETSHGSSATT